LRSTLAVALLVILLAARFAMPLVAGSKNPAKQADTDNDDPAKPKDPGTPKHTDPVGAPKDDDKPPKDEKPPKDDKLPKDDKPTKDDEPSKDDDKPPKDDKPPEGEEEPPKDDGGSKDDVNPSGESNEDLTTPGELLTEAERLLDRAREANRAKNFKLAAELAGQAERLAILAIDILPSVQGIFTRQQAQEAIDAAGRANTRAAANLSEAESNMVDTESLKARSEAAKQLLRQASNKLGEGNNASARALAIQAMRMLHLVELEAALLAEEASSLIFELNIMGITPANAEDKISIGSDRSNNTVVQAQGHNVTFGKSSPYLTYTMYGTNGKGGFEANLFALIEFADSDGDDEIDEGEVVKVLPFGSLDWTSGEQKTTRGEETTLEVWYHFRDPDYDFLILMKTFEAPVIGHFSSGNDTVVYFVDGNANDVKLDLIVNQWPWSSQASELALRVFVAPKEQGSIETRRVGMDEEWVVVSSGGGTVRVRAVTKAEVQQAEDLSSRLVDAKMIYKPLSNGEIMVDFVYPNFGENILYHDPEFGVGGALAYIAVLSPHILALLLGILAVVLLIMRRPLEALRIRTV